jgi:hypothetical protein
MKIIGITLDEVLRDFLGHLSYAVAKIREEDEYVVTEGEVTEFDLVKYFKFTSKEEMYNLFYKEASLEIFGHPDQLHDRIINKLNLLYMDLIDEEEDVDFVIMSREVGRAVPATLFFLSKTECEIPNIKFVTQYEDMWKYADVIISATPDVLTSKPEGKVAVKVTASYNADVPADHTIQSLVEFIDNESIRNKILN